MKKRPTQSWYDFVQGFLNDSFEQMETRDIVAVANWATGRAKEIATNRGGYVQMRPTSFTQERTRK